MDKGKHRKLGLFVPTFHKDYNKVSASIWIRVLQMVRYYRTLGIQVHINNPFYKYDAAIYYRSPTGRSYHIIKYLKQTSKKVYFDTCVNYFALHPHTGQVQVDYMKKIARMVDGVICSTANICEYASGYSKDVFIMDDPIDLTHFQYVKNTYNFDMPLFGWSGISVKIPVLNEYAKDIDNRILLITDKAVFNQSLDFRYKYIQWRHETFPFVISQVDIALLNRHYDNIYDKGNSSFKALVFAAQSVPIIASRLPSYEKLAGYYDGIVFLEDYQGRLNQAIIALKARNFDAEKVRKYYSCENQASRLLSYLKIL